MASPAPRISIARPSRSSGLLSIPASATQRKPGQSQDVHSSRTNTARLKIIIRRLPPGLTQAEFEGALGDDWRAGDTKVDWAVYKTGKVSKDPTKPSRPSRAYLHVKKPEYISVLADKVRNTTFADGKGSSKDLALLGPPSVEFAPYGRVPSGRPRKDARQGTIDQDPEFIDFLESLTNPLPKPAPADQENDTTGKSKDKATTTPLVQFLKEKKANKGKENIASQKVAKHNRQDSKDVKASPIVDTKPVSGTTTVSSPKKRSVQAVKVEQAARDAVKVLNKQAANVNKSAASPSSSATTTTPKPPAAVSSHAANAVLADKKRERGSASAAAKILQRDLGLGGNAAGRGARRGAPGTALKPHGPSANTATKQENGPPHATNLPVTSSVSAASSSGPTTTAEGAATTTKVPASYTPTGPAASSPAIKTPNSNTASSPFLKPGTPSTKPPVSPSQATQAFLKHANPSQGITEPLLEEAFTAFGTTSKVEIDKKKGFAYVDFAEPEALQKAIKASPIKVAQGQVVVLERKTGPNLQARNMRGGSAMMGNRGGGMPMGGRGGLMRGRGGYGRGGMNISNTNNAKSLSPANPAASKQPTAAARTPTVIPPTGEGTAAPAALASSLPAD